MLASYNSLLSGERELSGPQMDQLIDVTGRLQAHRAFQHFLELVHNPFSYLTVLVWRVKELDASRFGPDSERYLAKGTKQNALLAEKEVDLVERLESQLDVSLKTDNGNHLRVTAIGLIEQLEKDLGGWAACHVPLGDDESFKIDRMLPTLPLSLEVMFNLYIRIGEGLEEMMNTLNTLKRSLQLFGSAVDVNVEMVQKASISVYQATLALQTMRTSLMNEGVADSPDKIEAQLDERFIYPHYHQVAVAATDDVLSALADDSRIVHEVEVCFNRQKKKWLEISVNVAREKLKLMDGLVRERGGEKVSMIDLMNVLPYQILDMVEVLLKNDLIDEVELLMRVQLFVTNTIHWAEFERMEELFAGWKKREELTKQAIQDARRCQLKDIS